MSTNKVKHVIKADGLQQKLIDVGVIGRLSEATDYDGSTFRYGWLNMAKCNPDKWKTFEDDVKAEGYITTTNPADVLLDKERLDSAIVRWSEKEGERVSKPDLQAMSNTDYNAIRARFVASEVTSFEQIADGVYRRPLTEKEVKNLAYYPVQLPADGDSVRYYKDWTRNDIPAMMITECVPDIIAQYETRYEGRLNSDGFMKNGDYCTESGKSYLATLDVSHALVKSQNDKQYRIMFPYGKDSTLHAIYVDKDDVVPVEADKIHNGKARDTVYLDAESYKVYNLTTHSVTTLSPFEICDGYDLARSSYAAGRQTQSVAEASVSTPESVKTESKPARKQPDAVVEMESMQMDDEGMPFS